MTSRCGDSQQFDVFARFACERKLIHLHPSNSTHPFFQPNCKRTMVIPMNVKEFDNFFSSITPFFVHISSKIVNFVFSSKMLNFAISSVFRPKRISCVPKYCLFWYTVYLVLLFSYLVLGLLFSWLLGHDDDDDDVVLNYLVNVFSRWNCLTSVHPPCSAMQQNQTACEGW